MLNKQPILETKTKTYFTVDSNDLDIFVHDVLGFEQFEFVAVEESNNNSKHSYSVSGILDKYDKKHIEEWKSGEFVHYSTHNILDYLCQEKFIPSGEYLIEVCW